ncbi:hypothetical protein [Methanohalobium evestigatum]|uniref:hypothetical protein n=1 Tax=Methanohalobium evestigatum TaxID=2322 RepID=UPI0012F625A5|nr:hypothetical protein [Methanohalobium evestigatum]
MNNLNQRLLITSISGDRSFFLSDVGSASSVNPDWWWLLFYTITIKGKAGLFSY